ncbi:MAG: hypothetical protein ACE5EV_07975, partial [Gaiellales bacterium]
MPLADLLESNVGRSMLDTAQEKGFVDPSELEDFALEHDLAAEDLANVRLELESVGVELPVVDDLGSD